MSNVVESVKEVENLSNCPYPYHLEKCCCLLLIGSIIGAALYCCGLLDLTMLGVWLFLMLVLFCLCCCFLNC